METNTTPGSEREICWDVYVDPLIGTQRVTLCYTELLSPFYLIMAQEKKLLLL